MVEAHDLNEILDRLEGLGDVAGRPMFRGHGLFWRETIFGILFRNRLYTAARLLPRHLHPVLAR